MFVMVGSNSTEFLNGLRIRPDVEYLTIVVIANR